MDTWALVPVNDLKASKSRLAKVLSKEDRERLSLYMLIRTLNVLSCSPVIERTLVISRDEDVVKIARDYGAYVVNERSSSDLNLALHQATEVAVSLGASSVLVIPTDLPLLQSDDIATLTESDGNDEWVMVAPDGRGEGTNALFIRPPGLIQYSFGPRSLKAHTEQAESQGIEPRICQLPGTQLDVDIPQDLEMMQTIQGIPE